MALITANVWHCTKKSQKLSASQTLGIDNKPLNCRVVMAVVVLCVCKEQIKGGWEMGGGRQICGLTSDLTKWEILVVVKRSTIHTFHKHLRPSNQSVSKK